MQAFGILREIVWAAAHGDLEGDARYYVYQYERAGRIYWGQHPSATNGGGDWDFAHKPYSPLITVWRKYYLHIDGMMPSGIPGDYWRNVSHRLPISLLPEANDLFRGGFMGVSPSMRSLEDLPFRQTTALTINAITQVAHSGLQQRWLPYEADTMFPKNAVHIFPVRDFTNLETTGAAIPPLDSFSHPHAAHSLGRWARTWPAWPGEENAPWDLYERRDDRIIRTCLHEIGHLIGSFQDHGEPNEDEETSIMFYFPHDMPSFNAMELNKLRRGRFSGDDWPDTYIYQYIGQEVSQ